MITKEDLREMRRRGYKRYCRQWPDWPKAWERQGAYETTIYVSNNCVSLTIRYWKSYPKYAETTLGFSCVKDALACESTLHCMLQETRAECQSLLKVREP